MEREGRGGSYHLASTSCYVSVTQVPRYEKGAAICITDFVWMLKVPVCSLACCVPSFMFLYQNSVLLLFLCTIGSVWFFGNAMMMMLVGHCTRSARICSLHCLFV